MKIENCTPEDIDEIFRLYKIATDYQKSKKSKAIWPEFDRDMVKREIDENRQWKIVIDDNIACIWATAFSDEQIWEERNADSAIYIHRIATNPNYRGNGYVSRIVSWAKEHAKDLDKRYIRMDTIGDNKGLITHYERAGFEFLGLYDLKNTDQLPAHYHNATVSLFQIDCQFDAT